MKRKIAIIGAGPAGLAAALEGVRRGMKVTLLEKGGVGESIRCAEGYIDPLGVLDLPARGLRFKVEALCFRAGKEYELDTREIRLWITNRRAWQRQMAKELVGQGVDLREGWGITRSNYTSLCRRYDWIIDASGAPAVTSYVHGFHDFYLPHSLVAAQYILRDDFRSLRGKIKVGLSPEYGGYFWIFPRNDDTASVGIAYLSEDYGPRDLNKIWTQLRREIAAEGLSGGRILARSGGLCPAKMLPRLVWDNVILVGDAAGLASPLHGGGIDTALLSGREAVAAIDRGKMGNYRQRLVNILGPRFDLEDQLIRHWLSSGFSEIERLLAGVDSFYRGKGIGPLLPLSRDLLQRGYCFLRYWQSLGGLELPKIY